MLSSICFFICLWYLAYLLELWCLDSMLSGIMLPRFHDSSFIYDVWHSVFWNYVASIPCSLFHLRYLKFCIPRSGIMLSRFYVPFFHGMCILQLCRLDSIITDYLRTVFGIQRIYYTVFMLPRFHRVRTSRPGNSLWVRLKREKLEPISTIIWKKSPSKWV